MHPKERAPDFFFVEVRIMKYTFVKAGLCAMAVAMAMPVMAADVPQLSVLEGKVTSVAPVGKAVKEGDVLVAVESLVGAVPAARAEADGVVKEVRVSVGDKVEKQAVVVVLETKN